MAAKGTAVKTVTRKGRLIRISWLITAEGAGDVDENGSGDVGFFYKNAYGKIKHFEVHPDAVAPPAANFDIYIKDSYGLDLLYAAGVNLATATHFRKGILASTGVTNAGQDVILFGEDIEIVGDEMDASKICTVVLILERTPDLYA